MFGARSTPTNFQSFKRSREFEHDLSGTAADIERAAALFSANQPQRVFHKRIVDLFEKFLGGRGSVGFHFRRNRPLLPARERASARTGPWREASLLSLFAAE